MTDRAVSSVLDVTVCLLLVSASAVTLVHAPDTSDHDGADRADAVLEVLTTSTAWVEYEPATRSESEANRTAHGTLAGLLAAGAVANVTGYGEPVASSAEGFRRAVTAEVRRATARTDARVQVVARSRPVLESRARGRFAVGPSPPSSAEVHAASTTVPWSPSSGHERVGEVRLTVRTWSP
jgi:hypothetical protein